MQRTTNVSDSAKNSLQKTNIINNNNIKTFKIIECICNTNPANSTENEASICNKCSYVKIQEDKLMKHSKKKMNSHSYYPEYKKTEGTYGTSGYRLHSSKMISISKKCAVISIARSVDLIHQNIINNNDTHKNTFGITGMMITASHNPLKDNGIKLIDYNGKMYNNHWEELSDEFVNSKNEIEHNNFIDKNIYRYIQNDDTIIKNTSKTIIVLLFRDTRKSGVSIKNAVAKIIASFNKSVKNNYSIKTIDVGVVSTPLAHYITYMFNKIILENNILPHRDLINNIKTSYFTNIANILKTHYNSEIFDKIDNFINIQPEINVDTANGVPQNIINIMNRYLRNNIDFTDANTSSDFKFKSITIKGILNKECGADYIKYNGVPERFKYENFLFSYDGDMDRLIINVKKNNISIEKDILFDGDDFLVNYIVVFLDILNDVLHPQNNINILKEYNEIINTYTIKNNKKVRVGAIYSDFSNYGAIKYLENIRNNLSIKEEGLIELVLIKAKTGIKNFVDEAIKYDISVYFEPNGHGGITISDDLSQLNSNLYKILSNIDKHVLDELNTQKIPDNNIFNMINIKKKKLKFLSDCAKIFLPLIGDPLCSTVVFMCMGLKKLFFKNHTKLVNIKLHNVKNNKDFSLERLKKQLEKEGCNCYECVKSLLSQNIQVNTLKVYKINKVDKNYLEPSQKSLTHDENNKYLPDNLEKTIKEVFCRIFIRPSGTEPILRIYAESECHNKLEDVLNKITSVFVNE